MSITDELRKWAEDNTLQDRVLTTYPPQHAVHGVLETIFRIADRIDAEHERVVMSVMNDALYHANDESMAELGWVRLPKDADGVPVRVGDVMKGQTVGGGFGEPFEIVGYIMSNGELEPMDEHKLPRRRKYLHHHVPTVEDVLREFADLVRNEQVERAQISDETVAEYAAKLRRLAGDAS